MTSVWSTSSDLSYSIETILTCRCGSTERAQSWKVGSSFSSNTCWTAQPFHVMCTKMKYSWGFCSSSTFWSHHHCMQWNALGWSPLVTSQIQTLRHLTMKRRDRFCPTWVAKSYPTIQTLLCRVKHSESAVSVDSVQIYAKEFLSLPSSYEEFENTRQGDGMHDACATVREILLLVFKADPTILLKHCFYLAQCRLFLSPRLAQ